MSLEEYTTEQLSEEMARRERISSATPEPLGQISWANVKRQCEYYINYIAQSGFSPKDGRDHIFEKALEAVYGENIWEWVNANDDG